MAIVADGAHSFSDGTSNIVGLVAVYVSGHPADRDHPYGHQKYETFASAAIAFFLFVVALGIFREAVLSFIHPKTPQVSGLSFFIMSVTLLINLFVVSYERREGRRLRSDFLLSDSWHTLTDVFVTLGVFVTLLGIHLGVPNIDAVASFLIASMIIVAAIRILKRSSDVLCDKAALDTDVIENIVRKIEGVRDCHEIRTRGHADKVYVDLHVLVDPEMSVSASHHLANIIERDIRREIPGVCDVVVHVEPVSHEHDELQQ